MEARRRTDTANSRWLTLRFLRAGLIFTVAGVAGMAAFLPAT
jgi:hypothetical protein